MNNAESLNIDDILKIFNNTLSKILKLANVIDPHNPEISCARRHMTVLKGISPTYAIEKTSPKMWKYRKQIKTKDYNFFTHRDVEDIVDDIEEEDKELFDEIVSMIKHGYDISSEEQKNQMWVYINTILQASIKYILYSGTYPQ